MEFVGDSPPYRSPSQRIPPENRGVYFGPAHWRERNKRHICISFHDHRSLGESDSVSR